MQEDFIINAEVREDQGKGASRRLRLTGKVPAVLYGGKGKPISLQLSHNEMFHHLEHEAFYSHILSVQIDGKKEQAVLKDVQRHPHRPIIMHIDLQRVVAGQEIKMQVPLHFIGEDIAPGVKQGGLVEHMANEVDIVCLPKNLPEFIEVDISALGMDESVHMSDLKLPKGVSLQSETDTTVAAIHKPRAAVEATTEGGEVSAEVPTVAEDEAGDDKGES